MRWNHVIGCLASAVMLMVGSGCARNRIIEQLREDQRLQRQKKMIGEEISVLEAQNQKLTYEVNYQRHRQDAGERETAWWRTYGRDELKRCFEAVNTLISQMEGGSLQGLYSAYYGAACRPRQDIDRTPGLLIVDLGHPFDQAIKVTTGMTYVEDATQFAFLVLRPMRSTSGKLLYKVVWVSAMKGTVGGKQEKWFFNSPHVAKAGDVPAIFFPEEAGIYKDTIALVSGESVGKICTFSRRSVPPVDTLLTMPPAMPDTQFSFALMGVPQGAARAE